MIDYNDNRISVPLNWIHEKIEKGASWESIMNPYAEKDDTMTIKKFLETQSIISDWDITEEEWKFLVNREREDYEIRKERDIIEKESVIITRGEKNTLEAPKDMNSSWEKYKTILLESGISRETVMNIQNDSVSILNNLSLDTVETGTVKGMVVGSVQSGKTTNMGALMSMASNYGWNVFIVLTGMIEKLRDQTHDRLVDELTQTNGRTQWRSITDFGNDKLQRLSLKHDKYIITSLKQKDRLEQLLDWIYEDPKQADNLKVLIIDDEADQASVDTAKIETEDRKTINNLLVNLTSNRDKKGNVVKKPLKAINYVGYTATPYANMLNESSEESLYPKDFVTLLQQSRSYIGPTQIFGVEGNENYPGMNIIRNLDVIDGNEVEYIKDIHEESSGTITEGLKESVSYFIGASASLRKHGYGKPLSMMVHTSNRKIYHENIYNAIKDWLTSDLNVIKDSIKDVWEKERKLFSMKEFKEGYPDYEQDLSKSYVPHLFSEIEEEIDTILNEISPLKIDEDGNPLYHKGIHMSIDNSDFNSLAGEDHYRLLYPDKYKHEEVLKETPLFLVVGGNTLSRGLTIEGLISTYFLRYSTTSDTLMQMGRWFGYRVRYELYPRVWLTERSIREFEYLSLLDFELREEIKEHKALNYLPSEMGIRLKTSPQNIRLLLTSRNKSQGMISSDFNFSGASIQTTTFDPNVEDLQYNLNLMQQFIDDRGVPTIVEKKQSNSVFWENVEFENVKKFLGQYIFSSQSSINKNIYALLDWNEKMVEKGKFEKWNVIVVGNGKINEPNNNWTQKHFTWNKVNRSKLKAPTVKGEYRIKVLRGPGDLYRDIDLSLVKNPNLVEMIKEAKTENYNYIREELGLSNVPQLFLYCIDKDSEPQNENGLREKLDSKVDIAGLYISIPGSKDHRNYTTYVKIALDEKEEEDYNDIEG